ncbi:MAG TPA: sensor histidine kinase [Steroidobacteraceae bacterium]|jgi:signal transduction histidine kinase|nr:sensor histidine kinase [Steroidobacteraceae bacterium]
MIAGVRTMEELAASIAHEVNQPLAAIVVNAESCLLWLGKAQPDLAMARKAAERIIRNGQHATEVIRSVRAMLGNANSGMTRVSLSCIVAEVIDLMAPEIGSRSVTLETQLCRDADVVCCDRTQIRQVLINLIRNALEAMCATDQFPRRLQVRLLVDPDKEVSIAISDTGPGLDASTAKRIFEPFFTTKSGGMGLGLAICRSIVQAHGGRLWAQPRAPRGCTFEFTLPAHDRG